eukprot:Gb_03580 [translate_table: standard]
MLVIEIFSPKTLLLVHSWMWVCCLCGVLKCSGNGEFFQGRKWSNGLVGPSSLKENGESQRNFGPHVQSFEYTHRVTAGLWIEEEDELLIQSPSPSRLPSAYTGKQRSRRVVLGIILGSMTGFAAAAIAATLMRTAVIYINRAPLLNGPIVFDPRIGSKMLASLEQEGCLDEADLVGVGPNGRVYKANLENGMTVAVKKISSVEPHETVTTSVKRKIQEDLQVLGRVRHRNLVALQAYVRHPNAHLLVYNHMSNGSLEDALKKIRDNQLQLSWPIRHKIAVGTITGLQHLHFHCNPHIVHRDLKPANILLDDDFEPHLSDFGLGKLMPNSGAAGYIAPECYQACMYTDKSDVFSFGVVLAVLLTGKEPTDGFFNEVPGGTIGRWLRHLQQTGKAFEALDKKILDGGGGPGGEQEEVLMAVRIAAACLAEMPADRPTSEELVPMLTQLHSF